jgi:TetR/AcrR family transcriptional repressor of mexJK operon
MAKQAAEQDAEGADEGRSAQKRRAILAAATDVFLKSGYLGTNMDEIATLSGVSKQTVYKHFASKEGLFVEIVSSMTNTAGDQVHKDAPMLKDDAELADYLTEYAHKQLSIVLAPRIMQLRRLVIGEVSRFPELARVLYERGPLRAMKTLAGIFEQLAARGLLRLGDPMLAASHFNWLVMSDALNVAMLLGDDAIPKPAELRRQAEAGVRVFLAAYGAGK